MADLVNEYRQGVPVRELADRYNVHRTIVSEHARRHGLSPRHRSLDEDERAKAAGLYEHGLTMSEVAERFGISTGAARTALAREDVPVRRRGRRPGRVAS